MFRFVTISAHTDKTRATVYTCYAFYGYIVCNHFNSTEQESSLAVFFLMSIIGNISFEADCNSDVESEVCLTLSVMHAILIVIYNEHAYFIQYTTDEDHIAEGDDEDYITEGDDEDCTTEGDDEYLDEV